MKSVSSPRRVHYMDSSGSGSTDSSHDPSGAPILDHSVRSNDVGRQFDDHGSESVGDELRLDVQIRVFSVAPQIHGFGWPQCGQFGASFDTTPLQALHGFVFDDEVTA